MSHEIIRSLEKIQDQVKQELQNVKTYRAFLALDKAIDEISEIEDIARSLTGIRGQVVDRLNDVREYRALLAVEKSVLDISEVLSVLEEASRKRTEAIADRTVAAATGQAADAGGVSVSAVAAEPSQPLAATAATAIAPNHGQFAQPPAATAEVAPILGGATHEADVALRSVADAMENPPSLSTLEITSQTGELQQHPLPTGAMAEYGTAHVVHEADVASRSQIGTFEHSATSPTAQMDAQTHESGQPSEPHRETADHDVNSVAQRGDAPESEDAGIAKVA